MVKLCSCVSAGLFFLASPVFSDQTPIDELVAANQDFACRLYQNLAREEGNLFLSPHSISVAMAMTYGGAGAETESQMRTAMGFPFEQNELHPVFGELDLYLSGLQVTDQLELLTANSIWPHSRFEFREAFLELVREHYRSDVYPVDYNQAESARLRINEWVEEKTKDKIQDLIPSGVLNSLTRMVLVNAVYFKGDWLHPFLKSATQEQPFYLASGQTSQVEMMHGKFFARMGEIPGAKILSLPYKGNQISMLILLPDTRDGLPDFENSLSTTRLAEAQASLRRGEISVFIPKFSLTAQFSLVFTLKQLGMPDAFDESRADFSGMDGNRNNLFISEVIHKAFVDVNEQGTEAAAATGVIMQTRAMPRPTPVFRADRPFLFIIEDNQTGCILFIGRLVEPE